MEHSQVREILEQKKESASGTSEYNRIVNRISEFDYHLNQLTLAESTGNTSGIQGAKQKLQEIVNAVEEDVAREVVQEQRIAEVDEMKLPYDIDADFGTVGVNVFVRRMLKEERANNFIAFNAEYSRLNEECEEKVNGFMEREIQLQRQNEELQREVEYRIKSHNELSDMNREQHTYILKLEDDLQNANNRNKEIEQNRLNASTQIGELQQEIERLENLVDEQRIQFNFGEKGLQRTIEVTETVHNLYEQAKQATAEKRKVMITGNIGANFNTVSLPDGSTDVIHVSNMDEVEVVDSFQGLELPNLENPTGEVEEGTRSDVEESDVVLEGSTDAGESDQVEGATEASATTEAIEKTVSEEATETWEQSIERRIAELEAWKNNGNYREVA